VENNKTMQDIYFSNYQCTFNTFEMHSESFGFIGSITVNEQPQESFALSDLRGVMNENDTYFPIIQITDLFINPDKRRQYAGSNLIDCIINKYPYSVIFIDACPSKKEPEFKHHDYDSLTDDEIKIWDEKYNILKKFLEYKGFTNVNDIIAGYEFSEVYLYTKSVVGKLVYDYIEDMRNRQILKTDDEDSENGIYYQELTDDFICNTVKDYDSIDFNVITINNNIYGFFTEYRVDRSTLPFGAYLYELRTDSLGEEPKTIENGVTVDFFGSFITDCELDFGDSDYIEITEYDM